MSDLNPVAAREFLESTDGQLITDAHVLLHAAPEGVPHHTKKNLEAFFLTMSLRPSA